MNAGDIVPHRISIRMGIAIGFRIGIGIGIEMIRSKCDVGELGNYSDLNAICQSNALQLLFDVLICLFIYLFV